MLDGLGPIYLGTIVVAALLAVWAAVAALRRLANGEPLKAVARLLYAGVFGLAAVALVAIGVNLRSYQRLTHEQPGATLTFRQVAERHYALELELADGSFRALDVRGDEWQLDARVLKWTGAGLVLGLDTRFRFERLAGRYRDPTMDRDAERTVHELAPPASGFDLWAFAQGNPWLPFVDASYGSATYLPLADGARYTVTVGSGGLVARPANDAARRAIASWGAPDGG